MSTHIVVRIVTAAAMFAAIASAACNSAKPAHANQTRVERGKYLVTVGGCNDCHTPLKIGPKGPEPDLSRMLSGHPDSFPITAGTTPVSEKWLMTAAASGTAFSGPWGVSFAANLTPDQNTGLGIWTEEMFIKAVRTGRHMGVSREILPPMPWFNVGAMTDEDLKAVYAFLRSIRPIHNRVPDPLPRAVAQVATNADAAPAARSDQ
jgi:mono/diheme cytochrome c family protein